MRHESLELALRSEASLVQIFVAILCPPLRVWLATVGSLKSSLETPCGEPALIIDPLVSMTIKGLHL